MGCKGGGVQGPHQGLGGREGSATTALGLALVDTAMLWCQLWEEQQLEEHVWVPQQHAEAVGSALAGQMREGECGL
jgi:hypothetical protein